jgi:putative phosphoesterase
MKVALIGDIHANLPALDVVLTHARGQGAEAIWNVGDSVGYGVFPDEVVQRLQKQYVLSVIGHYDRQVLRFKKRQNKWRAKKQLEEYLALKWTYEQLSKKSRKHLRFLSREIRMKVDRRRILLTHTSPGSSKRHLTVDTSDEHLWQLAQQAKADVIVSGHSHRPFARQVNDVWFINPGSVGLPIDGDPRSSYATLQLVPEVQVDHYRLEYDVERLVTAICDRDLPEAFARMFLQGNDLDTVLGKEVA